jgi:hypothetical protein
MLGNEDAAARREGVPDPDQPVIQIGNPADSAAADIDDVEIAQILVKVHHVANAKLDIDTKGPGLLPANANMCFGNVDANDVRSTRRHRDSFIAYRACEVQDAFPPQIAQEFQLLRFEGADARPMFIQGHAWSVYCHRLPSPRIATDDLGIGFGNQGNPLFSSSSTIASRRKLHARSPGQRFYQAPLPLPPRSGPTPHWHNLLTCNAH